MFTISNKLLHSLGAASTEKEGKSASHDIIFSLAIKRNTFYLISRCSCPSGILCRFLSSAEVSTALRPFYFSVHPDLFGKYPEQRVCSKIIDFNYIQYNVYD